MVETAWEAKRNWDLETEVVKINQGIQQSKKKMKRNKVMVSNLKRDIKNIDLEVIEMETDAEQAVRAREFLQNALPKKEEK